GVGNRGMALDDALHLLGEDLLAPRVDARRLAAEEDEPAVGGETGAIAADAVADAIDRRKRLPRLLRVAEVAEREVAARRDPSDLIAPGLEEPAPIVGQHCGVVAQLVRRLGAGVPAHRLEAGLRRADALDEERGVGKQ